MQKILIHLQDASIVRDSKDAPNQAILMDCDGTEYFRFPKGWSDDAIYMTLRFANQAYDMGHDCGEASKQNEIKKALGI